ncbi:aminotransferase class I/II-fold pyridoxal phosphate-dependent enzyme [Streptomyces sp. NPDC101062]|uniref:aminotransferase class I/II-fold pyridoxal phosphate-dependent enzyme n=1 Tax=unclassified Streptomyces TaxID=2593676 RepID=UPI0038288E24
MLPDNESTPPATASEAAPLNSLLSEVLQNRLDVCANPLGPPPDAVRALIGYAQNKSAELVPPPYEREHPPYTGHRMYLTAYAQHLGDSALADDMIAGQGVTGFLVILAELLREEPTAVITPEYTGTLELFSYADFEHAELGSDTAARRLERVHRAMSSHRFVVLSNPNNPLGHYIARADLEKVCAQNPGSTLIVDEEYIEFQGAGLTLIGASLHNLVVLQSTGKTYGITGTRAGIMWTRNQSLRAHVESRTARKWPLSILDAVVATAALEDEAWLSRSMEHIGVSSRRLEQLLREHFGNDVAPGSAIHYRFVWLNGEGTPDRVASHMRRFGVEVRPFDGSLRGSHPGMRLRTPVNEEEFSRLGRALTAWRADATNSPIPNTTPEAVRR